jgi:hypothetical protein
VERFSSVIRDVFRYPERLDKLEAAIIASEVLLRGRVVPSEFSPFAKIPVKVEVLNQACLRRILDLANACVRDINEGALAPAFVSARAALETAFSAIDVGNAVQTVVQERNKTALGSLDERIMKGLVGSKSEDWGGKEVAAINILTIVGRLAKLVGPGITTMYADLSEHAHPNWAGTVGAYSDIEEETGQTYFVDRPLLKSPEKIGFPLSAATGALDLMVLSIRVYKKTLAAFVTLCEEELHDQGKWPKGVAYPRTPPSGAADERGAAPGPER